MDNVVKDTLIQLAEIYETPGFLVNDPSWFMHQVQGLLNQETMAFIASSLSYGNRKMFFPKIERVRQASNGEVYQWVRSGSFLNDIPADDKCFYRLHTNRTFRNYLIVLQQLLLKYKSIGQYVADNSKDGFGAVKSIVDYFSRNGVSGIIPKNTTSSCKRICMFLRWMVRDGSPVDLGIWSSFIDKRTLIMPLDVHVVEEARCMGLFPGRSVSMNAAQKLTLKMKEVFPDDPLKGDFALFGYGVNKD